MHDQRKTSVYENLYTQCKDCLIQSFSMGTGRCPNCGKQELDKITPWFAPEEEKRK